MINLDFENANYSESINSIHPYPAKFIPEIPRALIERYGLKKGTAIFDPFCGSGTTLLEAARNDSPSVGVDLNPIACLISRVKTSDLPKDFSDCVKKIIHRARISLGKIQSVNIPNLDHWFKKDIQIALSALVKSIETISEPLSRDCLSLALSSIIVKVSNQESDTRYAAIDKDVDSEMVFDQFSAACQRLYRIKSNTKLPPVAVKVITKNLFDVSPAEIEFPVGLVITSPPYPNAYEYWLYHKYRMWWLGYDPIAVKKSEIGARAHFFRKNPDTEHTFKEQMLKTFQLLNKVVIKKGKICFIVGRSIIHGKTIDNGKIVENAAKHFNFKCVEKTFRTIAPSRKSFNLAHAKIKKEEILVFEK